MSDSFELTDPETGEVHDQSCFDAWSRAPSAKGLADMSHAYCQHGCWWQPENALEEAGLDEGSRW